MRYGIDCRLWNQTGVGRYIRNLVIELSKIDNTNEYVLFVLSEDKARVLSMIHKQSLGFDALNSNFMIQEVNLHWHSLSEQFKFAQILNNQRLDLVHFPYFSHPVFYNKPFVITIHDLIINHFPTGRASTLPPPIYHLKRFFYRMVLQHAINSSKKIIVPLEFVKKDLADTLRAKEEKIVVTKEGFDTSISRGEVSEKIKKQIHDPYFLYVGNAYPHKNLERLVSATESLNIKLLLVGRDDFFYKRLEKVKNENIVFLHDVTDSELHYLYLNSVAAVSSSLMEGFGLLPLESFGAGTLPVVSDIPAFREICRDSAIYFDPNETADIAKKLKFVLDLNKTEREEIIKKGKEILKEFSWKKMAEQTLDIYNLSV